MAAAPGDPTEQDIERLTRQERVAWNVIPSRVGADAPMDLSGLPGEERDRLNKCAWLKEIISRADGNRDLLQILRAGEKGFDRKLASKDLKDSASACKILSMHGYLRTKYRVSVDKQAVRNALGQCGLGKGDIVFVHSSLSALGHVIGGAITVIEALIETVGHEGILAVP